MSMSLQDIYNEISENGKDQLRNEGVTETGFDVLADPRRSLDSAYVLPVPLIASIDEKVLQPLKVLFSEMGVTEVVYSTDWLHMTLFSFLSVIVNKPDDFFVQGKSASAHISPYHGVFKEVMLDARQFKIVFDRVVVAAGTATKPGCIFIGGTPENDEVENTRKKIHSLLTSRDLECSQKTIPNIFHITVARWQHTISPQESRKVIDFVERLDGHEIWSGVIGKAVFCSGGYIMTTEKTVVFDEVVLKSNPSSDI